MQIALTILNLIALALCLTFWVRQVQQRMESGGLLPQRQHESSPIGIVDGIVTVFFWLTMQALGSLIIPQIMDMSVLELKDLNASQVLEFSGWAMLLQLVATLVPISWYLFRHRRITWLGQRTHFGRDIVIGIVGFFMIVPVVMLVQLIATQFIPYTHQTLDSLKENFSARSLAWAWISAVAIAPVTEEFFFRGVIQGFLQRVFDHDEPVEKWFSGGPVEANHHESTLSRSGLQKAYCFWAPIFISSMVFSAMHVGQGPAPIPLFLLAIGLGYVFRRTGSWIPCVLIHFLLNLISLTLFSLQLFYPESFGVDAQAAFAF